MSRITDEEREALIREAHGLAKFSTDSCLRMASTVEREIAARMRARTVAILDDDDQDPAGVHHGHSRRPRTAQIIPFPLHRRLRRV